MVYYWVFLSLGGIPFSCGFYSKDLIIELFLIEGGGYFYFLIFFVGVFFTIIYSIRLIYYLLLRGYGGGVIYNYGENSGINFSIFFLSLVGVFFGGMMRWILFDYSSLIVLSKSIKLITIICVIFVFWFWVPVVNFFNWFYKGLIYYYFISMWFLISLASFACGLIFKKTGVYTVKGDFGWGEVLGGVGLSNLVLVFGRGFQKIYYNTLFVQLFLIVIPRSIDHEDFW